MAKKIDWKATTWEGSRAEQYRRWAKLSLDEILEAQEQMAELAKELATAPVKGVRTRAKSGKKR